MVRVNVQIDTSGIDKIVRQLQPDEVHRAVMETAKDLQQEMATRAPGRRIRKSLRRATARTKKRSGQRAEISGVWWWIFPNYGTRYQGANGFATKASEAIKPRFKKRLEDLFR